MENKFIVWRWKLVKAIRTISGMFIIAGLFYAIGDFLKNSKG